MSESQNIPLGLALQSAGLISEEQLQKALEVQSKYTQMKLGEILVLQEGITAKTIEFFVKKRHEIAAHGQQFPIGYYLEEASLLNSRQVETILQEQKTTQQKFGDIAVQKGWIKQDTIDYFLKILSLKSPQPMSLGILEEYDKKVLHLEDKYANPSLILSRILAWTGGNFTLTKSICHTFANTDFNIPEGMEINAVDRFIEDSLIKNWQVSKEGTYIRWVKQNLINNQRCDSNLLLKEYQQILLAGSKNYRSTKEQDELLTLRVISKEDDWLKVANLIYQQVFNQNWIAGVLKTNLSKSDRLNTKDLIVQDFPTSITEYQPNSTLQQSDKVRPSRDLEINTISNGSKSNTSDRVREIPRSKQRTDSNQVNTKVKTANIPEPLTKASSLITLAAIALLIPLFLTINNYYSSLSRREPQPDSSPSTETKDLEQFCSQIDYVDSSSALSQISQIERRKQELPENTSSEPEVLPDNCNTALNRLRVLAAPQLGRDNRVFEAIELLCLVPPDSEVYVEAEVWLERWYSSSDWGEETKFYLQELTKYSDAECPAAHFREYES